MRGPWSHRTWLTALLFLIRCPWQEIDELCDEWEPEPLYPPVSAKQAAWKEPVISSQTGTQVRGMRLRQGCRGLPPQS